MLPPPKPVNLARNLAKSVKLPSIEECKSYGVAFNEVDLLPFIEKARPAIDALFAADWPVTNADEVASYAN